MDNTSSFLNKFFQNIQSLHKENHQLIWIVLLLVTIPLPLGVNNVVLASYVAYSLFSFKKEQVTFSRTLALPIILFVWMMLSYFWSIDKPETLSSISKEISLFLIPIGFVINPRFSLKLKQNILKLFSYTLVVYMLYFMVRACIRYMISGDFRNFFYHGEDDDTFGLIPKLLNAIHMSFFVAVALFYFVTKEQKSNLEKISAVALFGFLFLMASKNIILITILLLLIYFFFYSKSSRFMRLRNLVVFVLVVLALFSIGKIKNRFQLEFQKNTDKSISANVLEGIPQSVHNVSIYEAWHNETFSPNDFFAGTAFRVYQLRIFVEFLKEEPIFLSGFGLNASYPKIKEKAHFYNLYAGKDGTGGYQNFNFHNQYVQIFAELGIVGFLLLSLMLCVNLVNALKTKDFIHFAFAILTISLFLTESFLWRQRGVVFFSIMYCLFNTYQIKKQETATNSIQ